MSLAGPRLAALAGGGAAAASVAVAQAAFGQPLRAATALGLVALAAALAAFHAALAERRLRWTWLPLGLAALAALNAGLGAVAIQPYGDLWLLRALSEGERAPRWLVGTALLAPLYRGLWQPLVPGPGGVLLFTRLCGIAVTAVCGAWLLRRHGCRPRVALPLLTPLWVLFAVGHPEYYPFAAGPFLVALLWLLARPLERRPALAVGAVAGGLPALYVGFAPLGACALAALAWADRRRAAAATAAALLAYLGLVALCWPGGAADYFRALAPELNLGERNTAWPPYFGRSAGRLLPFFAPGYAISAAHLRDLAYLFFYGAGPGLAAVALGALAFARRRASRERPSPLPSQAVFGGLLACLQGLYFGLMIPKLGPRADLDLFFAPYLVWAAVAGALLEWSAGGGAPRRERAQRLAIWIALGALVPGAWFLVLAGVPLPS